MINFVKFIFDLCKFFFYSLVFFHTIFHIIPFLARIQMDNVCKTSENVTAVRNSVDIRWISKVRNTLFSSAEMLLYLRSEMFFICLARSSVLCCCDHNCIFSVGFLRCCTMAKVALPNGKTNERTNGEWGRRKIPPREQFVDSVFSRRFFLLFMAFENEKFSSVNRSRVGDSSSILHTDIETEREPAKILQISSVLCLCLPRARLIAVRFKSVKILQIPLLAPSVESISICFRFVGCFSFHTLCDVSHWHGIKSLVYRADAALYVSSLAVFPFKLIILFNLRFNS